MFRAANHTALDFRPVDLRVDVLIDLAYHRDVVAAHEIQAVGDLGGRFWVVGGPDDALDGLAEDEVGLLVEGLEDTCEGAAVGCEEEDFLCWVWDFVR